MSERKLARGLDDIAPNNSDKAFHQKSIDPNPTKKAGREKEDGAHC